MRGDSEMSAIYIPLNSFFDKKISMKDLLQAISIVGKSKAKGRRFATCPAKYPTYSSQS